MYTDLALHIGGAWRNGDGRQGEDVINPATEKPLGHLPHASASDLDEALAAAEKGFELWRATSAYDRAKVLRQAANLVRERAEPIGRIMTQEQGKIFAESQRRGAGHRRHHRMVCRRGPPRLRPHHTGPGERPAPAGGAGAGRRGRRVHALELSDLDAGPQDRRLACGRLLDHHQAVGGDARQLRGAGALLHRCRPARGRAQYGVRGAGEGFRASDRVRDGAQDLVHRIGAGRQAPRRPWPPRA